MGVYTFGNNLFNLIKTKTPSELKKNSFYLSQVSKCGFIPNKLTKAILDYFTRNMIWMRSFLRESRLKKWDGDLI